VHAIHNACSSKQSTQTVHSMVNYHYYIQWHNFIIGWKLELCNRASRDFSQLYVRADKPLLYAIIIFIIVIVIVIHAHHFKDHNPYEPGLASCTLAPLTVSLQLSLSRETSHTGQNCLYPHSTSDCTPYSYVNRHPKGLYWLDALHLTQPTAPNHWRPPIIIKKYHQHHHHHQNCFYNSTIRMINN